MVPQERQIALTRLATANPTITLAVFETWGAICVSPVITPMGAFAVHRDAKHSVESAVVFIAVPLIKVFGFVFTHKLLICLECCCCAGREQGSQNQEIRGPFFHPFPRGKSTQISSIPLFQAFCILLCQHTNTLQCNIV